MTDIAAGDRSGKKTVSAAALGADAAIPDILALLGIMKNAPERADGCSGSCIDDHAADTVHDDTGPAGTEELHMAPAQHWSLTETAQARIESVAFEALLQGLGDGRVAALLRILGWPCQFKCFALAGTPKSSYSGTRAAILRAVHDLGGDGCLIGRCGSICVAIIEIRSAVTPEVTCTAALGAFDDARPVCLGSAGANASGASRVTRGVLNALRACPAVSPLPRPMRADDVLPERALLGDDDARDELVAVVYRSLLSDNADDPTLDTVSAFIQSGGSLDATARELNVHPNTVRYRLKRAAETTGWDATNPREAYVLQTAITLGRVRDGRRSS